MSLILGIEWVFLARNKYAGRGDRRMSTERKMAVWELRMVKEKRGRGVWYPRLALRVAERWGWLNNKTMKERTVAVARAKMAVKIMSSKR